MQPDQTQVLDFLLSAATRFGRQAGEVTDSPWRSVRIYLDPFRVDVVFYDASGIMRRVYRAAGDAALAECTATFLTLGYGQLPDSARARVSAMLAAREVAPVVLVDPDAGTCAAALLARANQETEPVLLFTLTRPAVTH